MHKFSSTIIALIIGFVLGLITAAAVSFYINNAEVPFIDRFADQGKIEAPTDWNPNTSLSQGNTEIIDPLPPLANQRGRTTDNVVADPTAIATTGNTSTSTNVPAANTQFYVQAGAFASLREAEQQRARLALFGTQATITQGTVAGQTIHRVRIGPFASRADAQVAQQRLSNNNIETSII